MTMKLVEIEKRKRENGSGYMKTLKSRWNTEFPQHANMSGQCLRDNAARFKKDPAIINLITVRKGESIMRMKKLQLFKLGNNK